MNTTWREGCESSTWVVKLGGSLASSNELHAWLDTLLEEGSGRVVIVPGGGEFADTVRRAQDAWAFSDAVAHHMALLAMAQFGLMLVDLGSSSKLTATTTEKEIATALRHGLTPVWLPEPMVLEAGNDVPASWSVTSDSLAAWLGWKIGAQRVVLVKSALGPPPGTSLDALVHNGTVDAAFGDFAARANFKVFCLGPGSQSRLSAALRAENDPGAQLVK